MSKSRHLRSHVITILVTVVLTLLAVVLFFNLTAGEKHVVHRIPHAYGVDDPQFLRSMSMLLGPHVLPGNQIVALHNGDEIFPAMLEAIGKAKRTITFETFIYWSGEIGRRFADALIERRQAGVAVLVLLDWVGAGKMDEETLDRMRRAGIRVEKYHPLRWYSITKLNNRTHRKLLVIDGRIGFTGGVGIADEWSGNAQDPDHWRDSHFRLEGPAVAQMQAAFLDNWIEVEGRALHGDDYFPPLDNAGPMYAQVFKSSTTEASESTRLMYLLSIASAQRTVRIANAYFVPDSLSVETLVDAAKRGVKVEIIVPGFRIDTKLVRYASRSQWEPLLEAGIAIYEFQPTMYHVKVMIVDDLWTSVGSTNFDPRSFRLNDEANLNIYDADFARIEIEQFERDKARSRLVTLESWRKRPWTEKAKDRIAGLFRLQL